MATTKKAGATAPKKKVTALSAAQLTKRIASDSAKLGKLAAAAAKPKPTKPKAKAAKK